MSAKVWKEYDLDNVAIEEISEDVQSYMKEIGEESRNIHRNRLVIEELLLRIKDSSDEVNAKRCLAQQAPRLMCSSRQSRSPYRAAHYTVGGHTPVPPPHS